MRERWLRETTLTLVKTDEICRAAESMSAQMKVLSENFELTVSVVKSVQSKQRSLSEKTPSVSDEKNMRECWNCGGQHEYHKKELCPACGGQHEYHKKELCPACGGQHEYHKKELCPAFGNICSNVGNQIIFLLSVVGPDPSSPRGQSGQ